MEQSHAAFYCGAMSGCGYAGKCGDSKRQLASACPFVALMPSGQAVPGDASSAFSAAFPNGACPTFSGGSCPTIDEYNKAVTFMDKGYIHEGEEDWIKADSVLFNAFIFLQLFNEVCACVGRTSGDQTDGGLQPLLCIVCGGLAVARLAEQVAGVPCADTPGSTDG